MLKISPTATKMADQCDAKDRLLGAFDTTKYLRTSFLRKFRRELMRIPNKDVRIEFDVDFREQYLRIRALQYWINELNNHNLAMWGLTIEAEGAMDTFRSYLDQAIRRSHIIARRSK